MFAEKDMFFHQFFHHHHHHHHHHGHFMFVEVEMWFFTSNHAFFVIVAVD
jgi:hypothetical protein